MGEDKHESKYFRLCFTKFQKKSIYIWFEILDEELIRWGWPEGISKLLDINIFYLIYVLFQMYGFMLTS
jgi:hypothetical protein